MTTGNAIDPNSPDTSSAGSAERSKALQVPGLTVSVFKDGEPLLHRGFGTRILGRDDTPVNTDTLFDLCSVTKHITASAAAKLVHDGKLKWNEPVTKYMPTWQFSDPVLTKSVTMVDLLSHRTGLASHNEMQMGTFRSSYHYSNLCFALATRVIEQVSGQAYPDFVAENLFDPLGIKDYEWCFHEFAKHPTLHSHTFSKQVIYGPPESLEARLAALKSVETPEAALDLCKSTPLEVQVDQGFPEDQRDFVGTGVFYVSANDMVKWATCLLNDGKAPDGTQVVHELNMITKVHNSESYMAEAQAPPNGPRPIGYGLGLALSQFGEYELWAHNGGMPGFVSRLVLIPRAKTFIYLIACPYGRDELFKDLPKIKLMYPLQIALGIKKLAGPVWPPAANASTDPTRALDYAGTYFHPGHGYATVLADAHSGELRLVRARNEVNELHPVFGKEQQREYFTFAESPLAIKFVKDDKVVDTRPLPKRKGGVAWRPKEKYDLVLTEESCELEIVFNRVD
ncbi:beta-lactamase/transpeptidase-like protein [Catenaria anguillulae PL171]|uniref:Beta-lactamase/transpeptidase-like protein n=1 Tax=Catenaria anguillulae PL171 TaxID=765915 RepID=A0A1Y2I0R1_9FUNG|nr:beta-lactamase/transpeptidase-like protein [Catenaria anguillulae PL171]